MKETKESTKSASDNNSQRIKGIGEASFWQRLTYDWNTNLIWNYGRFEGKVTPEILPNLTQADESGYLSELIENEWDKQVKLGNPSLRSVLIRVFGKEFMLCGFYGIVESIFKILQAGVLGFFIKYLRTPEKSVSEGCLLALALSASIFIASVFQHYYFFPLTRLAYKVRVGLIAFLFRKTLTISSSSMLSTGEAINIISNDVQPFENGIQFLHNFWLGPFQIAFAIVFLWINIGISCFVAVGVYLLMIPLQSLISNLFSQIRSITVVHRDSRVKLLTDILNGIEIVKLNSWEVPLLKRIFELRKQEHNSLKRAVTLKGVNESIFNSSSQIVYLFTFVTLWFLTVKSLGINLGNSGFFQPENIFPCVTIFSATRLTMTLLIPKAFESYGEIKISLKRIEKLILLPSYMPIGSQSSSDSLDLNHNNINNNSISSSSNNSKNKEKTVIHFHNASFSWKNASVPLTATNSTLATAKNSRVNLRQLASSKKQNIESDLTSALEKVAITNDELLVYKPRITLSDISLSINKGELLGVVGPVGSGKSSFCHAILGEMYKVHGELNINLSPSPSSSSIQNTKNTALAYASQSPWIFGGSIRENILFGYDYEEEWFNIVVHACSLDRDLSLFEDREFTLIGERGATLSGGQRARVALARAVYRRADIYVLDDPLSAVDPKVGKHLFDKVIRGLLLDKTVILVTHQLQFVHGCDNIVLLDSGHMVDYGPPSLISKLDEYQLVDLSEQEASEVIDEGKVEFIIDDSLYEEEEDEYQNSIISIVPDLDAPYIINPTIDISTNTPNNRTSFTVSTHLLRHRISKKKTNKSNVEKSEQNEKFNEDNKNEFKVGDEESTGKSTIGLKTYLRFFRFGSSYLYFSFIMILVFIMLGLSIYSDYYLSVWSSLPFELKAQPRRAIIYMVLVLASFFLSMVTCILLFRVILSSSNGLLLSMLDAVIKAPMSFFQSQPVGRVLNRFSKDQSNTDELLAQNSIDTLFIFFQTIGILVIVSISNIYLLISVPFILIIFFYLRNLYMKTSRQVKRIESVSRSPVYSLLSETLDGLVTIRSYSAQPKFLERFIDAQNANSRAFFSFLGAGRWLAFRLDIVNTLFAIISSFAMVGVRKSVSPNLAALSMSYIISLVGMVQWGIRQSIEVEITFISVERNMAYTEIQPEEPKSISESQDTVQKSWPEHGNVEINNLSLLYPFSKSPVLKNISMSIKACEKIGIVGRTGAGKSSLVSSIFRLVEPYPSGCIVVDDVKLSDIKLSRLRPSFSMIPQQPFLFEGSLRFNLDPWSEYSDEQIWNALEAASLKKKILDIPEKLESAVIENGKNFSVGERQLISLCRAILQNKRVIVMDEATANVDLETDQKIQKSIHTHFKNSTVITIAHRLNTVIGNGYDKIAVLDHGVLMEFGTAHELLSNTESLLSKMVANTGKEVESKLRQLAFEQFSS
ncbi:Multidrug resistance-associated protein 4 [Smittium culicis]|uniref:Multidrug resistance-associated protein 4 n=2 Tax=Smittium culicis TaxID=133412 RepID=A0A1R1YLE1_9FUNG|nr:Multidrug resistance-associated protein 4 [Smittium culicis]